MTALLEFFGSSTAQPVDSGDTGISGDSGSLLKAQFLMLEVLVVEAVAHEVSQIRNDSLGGMRRRAAGKSSGTSFLFCVTMTRLIIVKQTVLSIGNNS